jgi:hypothetical protein
LSYFASQTIPGESVLSREFSVIFSANHQLFSSFHISKYPRQAPAASPVTLRKSVT